MRKRSKFYYLILFFLIFVLAYSTYMILKPFISPIAWAVVFSIVFYPVYAFFLRYLRWRSLSAFITTLIIFLVIVGPIAYLSYSVVKEADDILNVLRDGRTKLTERSFAIPHLEKGIEKVIEKLQVSEEEIRGLLIDALSDIVKNIIRRLKVTFDKIPSFFVNFFLMLITIYFFLKDGPYFVEKVSKYLPFHDQQKAVLFKQIKDIIITTIHGGVAIAILQSLAGGFIFLLLEVPRAALLGFSIFFASFIPIFGTFIVWGPVAFYLLYKGFISKAIILFLLGAGVISMIDNVLRPFIVKEKVKMPLILVFFSILGGMGLFGLIGIIMGPLVVALFVSVLEIFRFTEED